ncbi:MAG: glycosyltransferase [Coprobacter sp.]|nr:glycosyltransferase [Coprobacter sp.]
MRILQVIDLLAVGGAERVAVDLSNILYENGEDITFLSLKHNGILSKDLNLGIRKIELFRTSPYSLRFLIRFIKIAKSYDIIHIHMRQNLKYVALASMFAPSLKRKIVFHDHYGSINTDKSCSISLRYILSHCVNAYIGVSMQLCDWAKKNGARKRYLLPNIIRKQSILDIMNSIPTGIVSVGNIRKDKNYEFLLKISQKLPQTSFTIYGQKNIPEYAEFITIHKGDNVKIIDNVSNVQPLLHSYEMAIHCATSETGPLVLIEYLAQGIPFITYRTGEVVSQIENELPELVIDTFDVNEWIERIAYILSNTVEIKRKMKVVFDKYYSETAYYNCCMAVYNEVK